MHTAELRVVLQLIFCIGFSKSSEALKQETQPQNNTDYTRVKHGWRERSAQSESGSYIKIQSAKDQVNVRFMQFGSVLVLEGKRVPIDHWQAEELGSVDEKRARELHEVEGRRELTTFTV